GLAGLHELAAGFRLDGESRRYGKPGVRHLGEARALAAEDIFHFAVAFGLAAAEEEYILGWRLLCSCHLFSLDFRKCCCHVSVPFYKSKLNPHRRLFCAAPQGDFTSLLLLFTCLPRSPRNRRF